MDNIRVGMEGPTRSQGDSAKEVPEVDYIQRMMRSLTDSSTSLAQSADQDSGMGSSSYSFIDRYGRMPDISPGLNPWGFIPPLPELRGLVTESNEPGSWRSPHEDFSPIRSEILADFPWLKEEFAASTSVVSKEESDACTSVGPLEQSTDQVRWAQSMLELHAFENSTSRSEEVEPVSTRQQQSPVRFADQELSTSLTPGTSDTPFNSESSSSLSDGEAELQERTRRGSESVTEVAGTSAQSGKRKRPEEDGEDAPSDDQETSKKPISRPRKKAGVKRVREPRYAIKTRTDTEVMDDGFKWRKYGQKAVKNSPHPRNYYRCTTANCPVRKRVERCFDDPGLVVTTYEGTHTHQSPSFLRGPPGYPGGLQGLLATLSHHYNLAGNTPLPPSNAFPMSNSDLYRSSPMSSAQSLIHENLNLLREHEQFLRLQQQGTAWATSTKNEPPAGNFQFPEQGPRFFSVSSLSDLSYDMRMSSHANASMPEQLGNSQTNPLEYSSLTSNGPFNSVVGLPDRSAAAFSGSGLLEDMFRHTNPSISRA